MLDLIDLSHRYPRADTWAVSGFTQSFRPGITGLLGPNGAGKSTLIRMITTSDRPAVGTIRWDGVEVTTRASLRGLRRDLGYLPQHVDFDHGLRCRDVLEYLAWLKEVPRSGRDAEVRRVLAAVGLSEHGRTRVRALSGGMRQRLGLAQALLGDPRLVVLDEPSVGLDPLQRQAMRAVLREIASRAVVLFSTHQVEEVAVLGGRVVVMAAGRAPFSGTVDELARIGGGAADSVNALERGLLSFFADADSGAQGGEER